MITEFIIKNILTELLFNNRVCESIDDKRIIDYLYEALTLERLLYGEPVTVAELRTLLRKKILNFEFIKLDGEIRPAKGTLMMKYVPQRQHPKGIRPSSQKVATFYDLEKKDWRSVSQRSKEIVLKKDEETGKPVIMVTDKSEPGNKAVSDIGVEKEPKISTDISPKESPVKQPTLTLNGNPIDPETKETKVEVKNIKPVKSTENTKTFYLSNPATGASKVIDTTTADIISILKKMGYNWNLVDKNEYEQGEQAIQAASEKKPDILQIGDIRSYLNNRGDDIKIEIIEEDPYGGFFAKTPTGGIFKIPANKMQNIGERIKKEDIKTKSVPMDIINKGEDLDNISASDI